MTCHSSVSPHYVPPFRFTQTPRAARSFGAGGDFPGSFRLQTTKTPSESFRLYGGSKQNPDPHVAKHSGKRHKSLQNILPFEAGDHILARFRRTPKQQGMPLASFACLKARLDGLHGQASQNGGLLVQKEAVVGQIHVLQALTARFHHVGRHEWAATCEEWVYGIRYTTVTYPKVQWRACMDPLSTPKPS